MKYTVKVIWYGEKDPEEVEMELEEAGFRLFCEYHNIKKTMKMARHLSNLDYDVVIYAEELLKVIYRIWTKR